MKTKTSNKVVTVPSIVKYLLQRNKNNKHIVIVFKDRRYSNGNV